MVSSYPSKTVLPATTTPPSPVATEAQTAPLAASLLCAGAASLCAWPLPQDQTIPNAAPSPPAATTLLALPEEVRGSEGYVHALRSTIIKRAAAVRRLQKQVANQKLQNMRRKEAEARAERKLAEVGRKEAGEKEKGGNAEHVFNNTHQDEKDTFCCAFVDGDCDSAHSAVDSDSPSVQPQDA